MGFDKDYPNRKDHRKPYHDSRAFDHSCRNNKSCSWCESNRTIAEERERQRAWIEEFIEACEELGI